VTVNSEEGMTVNSETSITAKRTYVLRKIGGRHDYEVLS